MAGAFCRSTLEGFFFCCQRWTPGPRKGNACVFSLWGSGRPHLLVPEASSPGVLRKVREEGREQWAQSRECAPSACLQTRSYLWSPESETRRGLWAARPRGWSPGQGAAGREALSPTRSGRGGRAPRARRGGVGALVWGCSRAAFVFEAPRVSGLGHALSPATPRALLPMPFFPPLLFPIPSLAQGKLPVPKKKKFTSGAEISDKKLPLPTTRRPQPATNLNFLPFNTYSPV